MSDDAQATIAGVRGDTLAEVADELYALPPAEFIAARDERARAARTAGRREDAAAIRKLARPTTSAWLVNRLSRDSPEDLARLFEIAEALQEAQRTLAGDRLRELSARRRKVVTELIPVVAAAAREAGQPASQAVLEEVRATLEAALADPDAREAVRSGRLTRALAYAGLGEVDLSAAAALTAAGPGRGGASARSSGPGRATRGVAEPDLGAAGGAADVAADVAAADPAARAAAAVAAAESAAASAAEAVSAAERERSAIVEQRQFLRRRISHLEGELAQTREEDARLAADAQRAERNHDAAARDLRAAARRLERARREEAKLGDPG